MGAAQDSKDAALGALRSGNAAQTLNLRQNMIAVHGVSNGVGWDENVAVELRHGRTRHHEAVAVVVEHETALDFITTGEHRWLGTAGRARGRFFSGRVLFRLAAGEAVSATR